MCILMAVAKFHGPHGENPDDAIVFRESKARNSWLNHLGNSFGPGRQTNFFRNYFGEKKFLNFERGSAHLTSLRKAGGGAFPFVSYYPAHLRLENLRLYKFQSPENVLLKHDDLPELAELLEKHGGWETIVPEIVARIQRNRPSEPATGEFEKASGPHEATGLPLAPDSEALSKDSPKPPNSPQQAAVQSSPYVLSGRWRDLFQEVAQGMEGRMDGWNWYVICDDPSWLFEWHYLMCNVFREHGAWVNMAFHSLDAPCLSILAHWRSACSHLAVSDPIVYGKGQLDVALGAIKRWAEKDPGDVRPTKAGGCISVYHSRIAHPYTAILAVPARADKTGQTIHDAPLGTWCLLRLEAPFVNLNERCGLYLNGPSAMLNVYYSSIIRFFESAGHCEFVSGLAAFGKMS